MESHHRRVRRRPRFRYGSIIVTVVCHRTPQGAILRSSHRLVCLPAHHLCNNGNVSAEGSMRLSMNKGLQRFAPRQSNERNYLSFHLLPHSETGFTGQREWNLQNVYNFMPLQPHWDLSICLFNIQISFFKNVLTLLPVWHKHGKLLIK